MSPDFSPGSHVIRRDHFLATALLDRVGAAIGDYERRIAAANGLTPDLRQSFGRPKSHRRLIVMPIPRFAAKVCPVDAGDLRRGLLYRRRRSRILRPCRDFDYHGTRLLSAAPLDLRVVRLLILEGGYRPHPAAVQLESKTEKQDEVSDTPRRDQRGVKYLARQPPWAHPQQDQANGRRYDRRDQNGPV